MILVAFGGSLVLLYRLVIIFGHLVFEKLVDSRAENCTCTEVPRNSATTHRGRNQAMHLGELRTPVGVEEASPYTSLSPHMQNIVNGVLATLLYRILYEPPE